MKLSFVFLILIAIAGINPPACYSDVPSVTTLTPGPEDLGLQVWALRGLHELDLTDAQLKLIRAMTPDRPAGVVSHPGAKLPEKYLASLRSLREALIKRNDEDRISELEDDLESMREDDDLDADDKVIITPDARRKVPDVIRLITATQVASYAAAYQDEVPDPLQVLIDAADDLRSLDDEESKPLFDETADEFGTLVIGLDVDKAKPVMEKARAWLKHAKSLSDAEYKSQKADLESSAKELIGDVDAFQVLRHWMERDISELLSNPQLGPAIDIRLKNSTGPEPR